MPWHTDFSACYQNWWPSQRPDNVVTYPVVRDGRSVETLRKLRAGGDCEIGAHHHAWETPPCTSDDVRRHPYALSLPSHVPFHTATGFTLSFAKQVLSGKMDTVIKTIERNVRLV